jgi:cation transport protein ChaC
VNHDREILGSAASKPEGNPGPPGLDPMPKPLRDPKPMLDRVIEEWGGHQDLWVFGYGSLIWRPEFGFIEQHPARVHGWHRALKMWSRVNRGTVENPGLVFGLLSGGSCRGMVFRVPAADGLETLGKLWLREMPTGVYDPKWLDCTTPHGSVRALAFTLSRRSPNFTGNLDDERYRHIFASAVGRYGSSPHRPRLRHRGRHQPAGGLRHPGRQGERQRQPGADRGDLAEPDDGQGDLHRARPWRARRRRGARLRAGHGARLPHP